MEGGQMNENDREAAKAKAWGNDECTSINYSHGFDAGWQARAEHLGVDWTEAQRQDRQEVMLREARAFIDAHSEIVDCAQLMVDFGLVILDLKTASMKQQARAEHDGWVEIRFQIEQLKRAVQRYMTSHDVCARPECPSYQDLMDAMGSCVKKDADRKEGE
jgi:hypothetical protein